VKRELDLNALETRVRRLWKDERGLAPVKQDYLEAVSRPGSAARREALAAFLDAHGEPAADADADERLLPALARRTLERLESGALREEARDPARAQAMLDEAAALDDEALGSADADHRAALAARARRLRRSVVAIYGDDPHAREHVEAAKRQLAAAPAIDTAPAAGETSATATAPTTVPTSIPTTVPTSIPTAPPPRSEPPSGTAPDADD
jgi:hypothetical protein